MYKTVILPPIVVVLIRKSLILQRLSYMNFELRMLPI